MIGSVLGAPMTERMRISTADTLPSGASQRCLTDDDVLGFVWGATLDQGDRIRLDEHLDTCAACFELVCQVARESQATRTSASVAVAPRLATTFAPGTLLSGRFHIVRFVARGGMGEVYEALDAKLSERVALKTVVCSAEDSPRAVRKLLGEVQLARRIQHPNVCRIHELHEHQPPEAAAPVPFLSMEYIDGERLGDYVHRRGRLPVDEAVHVARQLLDGLRAAHAAHVIHLDFKTDNVMLRHGRDDAEAVIMDFGLSRAFDNDARLRTSDHLHFAGSLAYMSPEQIECSDRLGPEADIYAFGIVFFEMLTGRLPFEGDSPMAVMMKRLKERPPPPSRIVPGLPPGLDAFVLKCLSRDRRARYQDVASMSAALREAILPRRARSWQAAGIATGLLAASFSLLAAGWWSNHASRRTTTTQTVSAQKLSLAPSNETTSNEPTSMAPRANEPTPMAPLSSETATANEPASHTLPHPPVQHQPPSRLEPSVVPSPAPVRRTTPQATAPSPAAETRKALAPHESTSPHTPTARTLPPDGSPRAARPPPRLPGAPANLSW
jgi:serine/threonine protein kinase